MNAVIDTPYIERDAGDGFRISAELLDPEDFHPNAIARVIVLAEGGKIVLDELTVYLHELHEVVQHTTLYSEKYAEALR